MSLPKVAYIAGEYPLVSLTFIQREIEALRDLGLEVTTCSMRRTPASQHKGPAEKEAAATTFYVLDALKKPSTFLAAQKQMVTRTGKYFSALKLAWTTRAPGLKAAFKQMVYFAEATVLARHLEDTGVQHMHNHFTTGSATVAMLVNELTGIPYSFMLHGPSDLFEPFRWRLDEKTKRAKFVATISHFARSQLMFFSDPAHWDKIHIIHCGVHPHRYAHDGAGRDDGRVRALFVGRVAPVKGLRLLIEAMTRLVDAVPNLDLVIVGDGSDRAVIEAAAKPLGDRVRFTGYLSQDEVATEMKACDFFVLPSFAEGVPVVLMEAFASGKPVIATRVAGVAELVEDKENGFLIAPGDVDGLAAAMQAMVASDTRDQMGMRGRETVHAAFNIDTEAARLARLFSGETCGLRPDPLEHGG